MSEAPTFDPQIEELGKTISRLLEGRNSDVALSALVHVTAATCRVVGGSTPMALTLASEVSGHVKTQIHKLETGPHSKVLQ